MMGAPTPPAPDPRPQETHAYAFTIAGLCSRCGRPESMHVSFLPKPDPLTECPIDHNSLETKLLIGDAGYRWSHCPYCNVMVEKRYESIGAQGAAWGRGRGAITERAKKALGFLHYLWLRSEP